MSAAVLHDYLPARAVDRRFWTLIGLSILFHGALFAGMAWQRKALPAPLPTLMATIRLIAPSEANPEPRPVAASAPAPAAAVPPKARQQVAAAEQRSAPRVTQPAGPANVPAQTSAPAFVENAATSVAPAASIAAPAEGHRPVRPQGDVLAAYRQHLTELFARGYEYPRIAALRGWEGEVRLRLKVARKGNLLGIALDRSSGFDVLDQHAQALLASHGDLPPLPEALEASEIQVIVPINYKLRKTT
ncbi:energy transducer TonB [Ferribacterium limneticum]|uniref:energy transducer TonB n=1 Tax=Ferribacterium limneticum TaxID=76259 RepID=UPI001CFBE167|nr:energy transducer TonB [Ferribacterium limneticum]UCV27384.1 TonB family protein [Ferribacterium limneticum]UCV31301.1 TonB family protein [Ferribacterium limneticum]